MKKHIFLIVCLLLIVFGIFAPLFQMISVVRDLKKEIKDNNRVTLQLINELQREKMPVENPPQWDERVTGVNGGHIWHYLDGKYRCISPKYLYYIDRNGDSVYIHKDCNSKSL